MVTSKSDDGLLYTLRHCNTGKPLRSAVHANRVKIFDADRDTFYHRHGITPKDMPSTASSQTTTTSTNDIVDSTGDVWYSIDRLLKHKRSGNKVHYFVRWQDKSCSWEPSENITDFAINEYYVRKEQQKKKKTKR